MIRIVLVIGKYIGKNHPFIYTLAGLVGGSKKTNMTGSCGEPISPTF